MSQQQENDRDPIEEEHTAMPEDDEDNDGESILADQRDNARLANRLQYYQQYAQRNRPDNPNSSDEEDNTRHLERGSMESKSRENEENEDDMNDDDDNLLNEYAPLGGETQTFEYEEETEEFGDFVSSSISEIRLEQIDAMLNTDNLEALEKNSLFSRITRESHRYVDNQNNDISSVTVEEETISVGDVPEPAEEAHHQKASAEKNHNNNNNNKPPVPPQEFRSIPPLTKEKVDMIKGIMANMKIKPPKNVATLQLLETVDKQIFRLGDEFPSTLEK